MIEIVRDAVLFVLIITGGLFYFTIFMGFFFWLLPLLIKGKVAKTRTVNDDGSVDVKISLGKEG